MKMNTLNKRLILLLTVSIFGIFGNVSGQSADELVRLALENNPEISHGPNRMRQ